MTQEEQVLKSWRENALPWIDAVQGREIESRRLATDQAIVSAILATRPRTLLDLGCGEGWLVREMTRHGIRSRGVDAVPALIDAARRLGGNFEVASYEEIARGAIPNQFDTVCCNFALIGKESVEQLFACIPSLLHGGGRFVVQTLHPVEAGGDLAYVDGWRAGSWAGFNEQFKNPPPWYFRTLPSWRRLFADSGLRLLSEAGPIHPTTGRPASVLFVATPELPAQ